MRFMSRQDNDDNKLCRYNLDKIGISQLEAGFAALYFLCNIDDASLDVKSIIIQGIVDGCDMDKKKFNDKFDSFERFKSFLFGNKYDTWGVILVYDNVEYRVAGNAYPIITVSFSSDAEVKDAGIGIILARIEKMGRSLCKDEVFS